MASDLVEGPKRLLAALRQRLTSPGKELRHEVGLDAPPGRVWDVLVDVDSWPDWNPTLKSSSGPLAEGSVVTMKLQLGRAVLPMRQTVTEVTPPSVLRWTTRQVPGVFEVERSFELEATEDGGTHLAQYESGGTWLAARVVPLMRRSIEGGYHELATALAARLVGDSSQ